MRIHKNSRMTPLRREEMARRVIAGQVSRAEATASFGVTAKTVSKWAGHFRAPGPAGMADPLLGAAQAQAMPPGGSSPCGAIARAFAAACKELEVRHVRTKPCAPKTSGKVERFIQTAMKERDCTRPCETPDQRAADLPARTRMHDWHRPHAALGPRPPISRLRMDRGSLLMHHS